MRAGGGLPPHFPPPHGHPLNGHSTPLTNGPGGPINASSLAGLAAVSAAAANVAAQAGRPTSTPSTPSNAFGGKYIYLLLAQRTINKLAKRTYKLLIVEKYIDELIIYKMNIN